MELDTKLSLTKKLLECIKTCDWFINPGYRSYGGPELEWPSQSSYLNSKTNLMQNFFKKSMLTDAFHSFLIDRELFLQRTLGKKIQSRCKNLEEIFQKTRVTKYIFKPHFKIHICLKSRKL